MAKVLKQVQWVVGYVSLTAPLKAGKIHLYEDEEGLSYSKRGASRTLCGVPLPSSSRVETYLEGDECIRCKNRSSKREG